MIHHIVRPWTCDLWGIESFFIRTPGFSADSTRLRLSLNQFVIVDSDGATLRALSRLRGQVQPAMIPVDFGEDARHGRLLLAVNRDDFCSLQFYIPARCPKDALLHLYASYFPVA